MNEGQGLWWTTAPGHDMEERYRATLMTESILDDRALQVEAIMAGSVSDLTRFFRQIFAIDPERC